MMLKKLKAIPKTFNKHLKLIVVVIVIAILGTYLVVYSHASTPSASINADQGTTSSGVGIENDSTASDGKKVVFGYTPTVAATEVATQCVPVWASGNQMIFNTVDSSGVWTAYIGDSNCQNGQALLPPTGGNLGASDVTPNGRYVLFEEAEGTDKTNADSVPGSGSGNELVLLDRNTGKVTQLTTGGWGTIWARINSTGTMVTWSQLMTPYILDGDVFNQPFGFWQVDVADVTSSGTITNERSYSDPSSPGFYETYGFYGNDVMFDSDVGVSPVSPLGAWMSSQFWLMNDSLAAGTQPTRVSLPYVSALGVSSNTYHEFMNVAPAGMFDDSGPWLLGSMSYGTDGLDMWRFKPDGSDQQRLTYFNGTTPLDGNKQVAGFPAPQYSILGQVAFDQQNPKIMYVAVQSTTVTSSSITWKLQVSP
jgi:hypothetical protein